MHILTCVRTVREIQRSNAALRGEGYVMVEVLSPLHQQVRIHVIFSFRRALHYFLADFPWLSTQEDLLFRETVSTMFTIAFSPQPSLQ